MMDALPLMKVQGKPSIASLWKTLYCLSLEQIYIVEQYVGEKKNRNYIYKYIVVKRLIGKGVVMGIR